MASELASHELAFLTAIGVGRPDRLPRKTALKWAACHCDLWMESPPLSTGRLIDQAFNQLDIPFYYRLPEFVLTFESWTNRINRPTVIDSFGGEDFRPLIAGILAEMYRKEPAVYLIEAAEGAYTGSVLSAAACHILAEFDRRKLHACLAFIWNGERFVLSTPRLSVQGVWTMLVGAQIAFDPV